MPKYDESELSHATVESTRSSLRWLPAGPRPRWKPIAVVGALGFIVGYGTSWVLGGCTTCATGTNPLVLGAVIALTAALAAYWGEANP